VSIVLTFNAVCLTWCFFRLTNFSESVTCVEKAFAFQADRMFVGGSDDISVWIILAGYGLAAGLSHLLSRGAPLAAVSEMLARRQFLRGAAWGLAASLIVASLALMQKGYNVPFIYFQF
jgi:hypothetical protein